MYLTQKALNYLEITKVPQCINSNFLITDLEKIIYTSNYDSTKDYKLNKLSKNMISLIQKWNNSPVSEEVFFMENNSSLEITPDTSEKCSALMVFPIYMNNKIVRTCYLL